MGRNQKVVTAKQVAEFAGVSQATVSMILNNYSNASFTDETRKKVLDACNMLGYRGTIQNGIKEENILLVVLPSCNNLSYSVQLSVVQARASEAGYICITLNTFRDSRLENSILQCIKTLPVAGAVFLYQPENLSILERASVLKPCVVVCDKNLDIKVDSVIVNGFGIGKIIAEHMIQLGHKNVAYIATDINRKYVTRVQRLEGIRTTYREYGFSDDAIRLVTLKNERISPRGTVDDYAAGTLLTNRFLEKYGDKYTGIIGYNDMICLGILDALKRNNKRVPQDYSVMGCDNIHLSEMSNVSLTTVEHYHHLRAKDAVDMLLRKIDEDVYHITDISATGITRVEYEPKIIIRSSTKAVKNT